MKESLTQIWLVEREKPLEQMLGKEFYKTIPKTNGVYWMADETGKIIYVGKANDLRTRLLSYKNAVQGRVSRKTMRLVRATRCISWELCADEAAALLREDELIRELRPKFNRMHIWPEAYGFIGCEVGKASVRLWLAPSDAEESPHHFGTFKGSRKRVFMVLNRFFHAIQNDCWSANRFPAGMFQRQSKSVRELTLPTSACPSVCQAMIDYLSGESFELLEVLLGQAVKQKNLSAFDLHWIIDDLETLESFFTREAWKNYSARNSLGVKTKTIAALDLNSLRIRLSAQLVA